MKPQGLGRAERINREKLFKKIRKEGYVYKGENLTLSWLPNGLSINRVGISPGRMRIKSSVRRNKLKRIWREIYRLNKDKLKKGMDLILIPCSFPQGKLDFWSLQDEFLSLIEKAGLSLKQ